MKHWNLPAMGCVWMGLLGLAGCGSPEVSESVSVDASTPPATLKAPYQSWQEVWSVEIKGKDVNARKVGYLVKSFSLEDPAGRYLVQDLLWDTRGFILAEGKAFAFENQPGGGTTTRDHGNTGFPNGVKRILKVTGEVQFREPTRPASASTPTFGPGQGS